MMEIIESTTRELRRIYKGLRPPILDDIGLVPAMESLIGEFRRRAADIETTAHFDAGGTTGGAAHEEICFYRILQESLNNIARHSGATAARIEFIREGGDLVLRIQDNGKGFEVTKVGERCFGIAGMRERAAISGGVLEVESRPGGGTVVTMRAPAENQTGEKQ